MVLDHLVDGAPKSGISMKSLQRMLEIKTYKTVWTMGHKIRKALAHPDANYKLAGLIEMDDTYFGAPKPGKRGRGAAAKLKWWSLWKPRPINPGLPPCGWCPKSAAKRFNLWYESAGDRGGDQDRRLARL